MAPSPAASTPGKRKNPHDQTSSANKRHHRCTSSDTMEIGAAVMNEVVYDAHKEHFPQRPGFDKGLYDVYNKAQKLVKQLNKVLKPHASVSKGLQNMMSKAEEAAKQPVPEHPWVDLAGSTGAGKSSLASRLADEPDLAKELSAGESCTSVPTLYMNKLSWQTTEKYAAEIQYYTIPKCRELLEDLLRQYNFFTFESDPDWTNKQRNEYSQQASTAFDTFRTLFRDRSEFESQGQAERTLSEHYTESDTQSLILDMVKCCEIFFKDFPKDDGAGYTRCEGNTMAELREEIDPLTAPNHFADESSLWPLVQRVSVGIPSSRIFQYVTIVDLPGITDTNKLRVNTTHDYIRKCHALWYVADVARICDDPILEETISNYAERFRGTLAIIATKIDCGLTRALAEDMRKKGQSVGDYHEAKKNIDRLQARLKEIRGLVRTENAQVKSVLREEQEELEEELESEETKSVDSLVDARNTVIENRLRRDKKKHLPEGADLPIHFVSNPQYDMYAERGDEQSSQPKFGDMNDTGIPGLRTYALTLASPGVWEAYTQHLMFRVKVLFGGVHAWAEGTPVKRRQAGLMDVVNSLSKYWNIV